MAGAPKGNQNRRKDRLLQAALRRELTQNPEDALLIAQAAIEKAKTGDIQAATFVRDTCDGKPDHRIDVTTDIGPDSLAVMTNEELRAAVLGRMEGFLRPAIRSLARNRSPGDGGDPRVN